MRNKRRWLACVAAGLGFALTGCQTWVGGMTLPSGRYLQHYPQYFAPDPDFPLPRELASQEDPDRAARQGPGLGPGPLAPPGAPIPAGPAGPAGPGLPPRN
jgi:hypothetical protein